MPSVTYLRMCCWQLRGFRDLALSGWSFFCYTLSRKNVIHLLNAKISCWLKIRVYIMFGKSTMLDLQPAWLMSYSPGTILNWILLLSIFVFLGSLNLMSSYNTEFVVTRGGQETCSIWVLNCICIQNHHRIKTGTFHNWLLWKLHHLLQSIICSPSCLISVTYATSHTASSTPRVSPSLLRPDSHRRVI